jgi:hypothetical protein
VVSSRPPEPRPGVDLEPKSHLMLSRLEAPGALLHPGLGRPSTQPCDRSTGLLIKTEEEKVRTNLVYVLLQIPDAALPAVVFNENIYNLRLKLHIGILQTACIFRLGTKIFGGDDSLFFRNVARHFKDLHTVQKRRGDGVKIVGCTDEQHAREINGNIHAIKTIISKAKKNEENDALVIQKVVVLLGIQHL